MSTARDTPLRRRRKIRSLFRRLAPYPRGIYRRTISKSSALKFKNYLKTRSPAPVWDFIPLASQKIRLKSSENVSVIGENDFNRELPTLLQEINDLSKTNDYESINGLLSSVNSLFMKFRDTLNTNDLLVDLKYCHDNFGKPLLEVFNRTASLIDHFVATNAPTFFPYLESQRLCCSIFYSLNFQEFHEFFKDHMIEWMVEFKKYITLNFPFPALENSSVDGIALAELRAAVCDNLSHYVIKEVELFQGYLSGFVEAVLSLLVSSSSQGMDLLTVSAIKFMTAVSRSGNHILLSSNVIIHQIYGSILIPLMLKDEEVELFEMNPIEFIRRDMEGSENDTIRRIACEFLKVLATHYGDKVALIVVMQSCRCYSLFYDNPKDNWRYKYCAIYLAAFLARDNAAGTSICTRIVNVKLFFGEFVYKYLLEEDVTSFPMIKAVALKFFILFKNKITKRAALLVLSSFTRLLTSPNYVVHSYAARCIEELLLGEDDSVIVRYTSRYGPLTDKARYTSIDIFHILPTLMSNLFGVLSNHVSEENPYVMKCIMRVVLVGDLTADIASLCVGVLTSILLKVCQNPKNSLFHRYLFESLIGLITRVCSLSKQIKGMPRTEDISLVSLLERKLYPCLEMILVRHISEFFKYAFRMLSKLAVLNRPLLPVDYYPQVFDILHVPSTWMSPANLPTESFLPDELKFSSVIYNKLVSSSVIENHEYYVLSTVIENLGFEVISPIVSHIWLSLFNRLQNKRTVKCVKNIIVLMSLFVIKDGPKNFVNSVQPNVFQAILNQFWIPNLKLITGPVELKLVSVASTRLICEAPDILNFRLWGKMLDSIVALFSQPEQVRVDENSEIPEFGEINSTYAHFYNGGERDEDPLMEIKDPRQFLVVSLSNLSVASQGKYPKVIGANLETVNQNALLQLCNLYNVSIV